MRTAAQKAHRLGALAAMLAASAALLTGCASVPLNSARASFFRGDYPQAETSLAELPRGETDRLLMLMERGTILQAMHKYGDSVTDWQAAADLGEKLDYYSISRGTASFAINDRVQSFRGAPYERTLMHAFAAKSYLAMSMWDDAAVEARIMIRRLESLYGFPDDAYCHYLAGFCLEATGDTEGAAFQYRIVSSLRKDLAIGEYSGSISPSDTNSAASSVSSEKGRKPELVIFAAIGRIPFHEGAFIQGSTLTSAPYAEVYSGATYLGRTYPFTNTGQLYSDTERRMVALKAAKQVTRIVAKEAVASAVEHQNQILGEILRLILFALETPDTRRWETLPEWLEIGRMKCPDNANDLRIVFKDSCGRTVREKSIIDPLSRSRKTFFTFCRDL